MAHNHASAGAQNRGRLRIVFLLTASYMVIEFIGAAISGSLALLADAAHMLTDVGGLGLALLAIWFAARPATTGHSYGFYRTEILAAMVNGLVLLGIGIYILYEAWKRFSNPPEVGSVTVIIVAIFGLTINVTGAILLRSGSAESLNVQGAFLEVVADLLGSIGVIVAGVIMLTTGWWYADPIFSIVIGLFIVPRTYQLLKARSSSSWKAPRPGSTQSRSKRPSSPIQMWRASMIYMSGVSRRVLPQCRVMPAFPRQPTATPC